MISPEQLRRYSCFANVDESSLKKVAMISQEKAISAGDVLFREDEPADTLYVVVEGEMDLHYTLGSGELRSVDHLVGGDLMVWSSVLPPHKTTSLGKAATDVKLIAIDGPKLRSLMDDIPQLGHSLMHGVAEALASRLKGARAQLAVV